MQINFKQIFAGLLLWVFCFYITPKEVLHIFTHHHDTEHHLTNKYNNHFEEQHHHCDLLKIDQQFSASNIEIPFYDFWIQKKIFAKPIELLSLAIICCFYFSSKQLRAPPIFVV